MKIVRFLPIAFAIAIGISSCGEENSTIGSTIVDTSVEIVVDSSFQNLITVESVYNDSVVGRTTNQLIGRIAIPGYGRLETDFLTQFMPAAMLDTTRVVRLDSLILNLSYNAESFTGDSLAPMQLSVYPLNKRLESPLYSSINPDNYYDKDAAPVAMKSYNASYLGLPDSLVSLGYKSIRVKLPQEMGKSIYEEYKKNEAMFSSPSQFTQYFPGFYIKTSYGSGCVVNVQNAAINLHYTQATTTDAGKDSTYAATQTLMAVTPEIATGNHIHLEIDPVITQGLTEGKVYLQAPAGLNLQLHLPVREIVQTFEESAGSTSSIMQGLINSLALKLPVKKVANNYGITPPEFLLFIRKSEAREFFEKKRLTDNLTSFYAKYDEGTQAYYFSDLRTYVNEIIEKKKAGTAITDADEEILLVPISVYTETVSSGSSYYYYSYSEEEVVTDIVPYISAPALGLVDTDGIKLQLVYSKQIRD